MEIVSSENVIDPSVFSGFTSFLLGSRFSVHSLALVNCQNSEIVDCNCFAHVFVVLEGEQI